MDLALQWIAQTIEKAQMRKNRRSTWIRPQLDHLDDRCLLSGYSPIASSGYTPAQITAAYGLNAITFTSSSGSTVKGNGSGATIALIEAYHDPSLASDLNTFDQAYSLPTAILTVVNQAGSQTNSGWAGEESLDVEWTHAIAPGANILVVEAKSQSLQDLLNAVNTARNTAGVNVVSMSWGFSEMTNESSYDSYFTTPAGHVGITFIAAGGDSGTVEYPSASPNVLSVGGTTLTLSSSGSYQSESAWYDSGGGYSQFEGEPSYQKPVQTTGFRSTPDVAFDANPNSGVEVYETPLSSNQGWSSNQSAWQVVGGTSLGAPSWAGIIAIVDQGRALAGQASLDGPTQTLPALYAAPTTDFNAITASTPTYPGGGGGQSGWSGFNPFGGFGGFESYSFSYWGQSNFGSVGGGTLSGATANTSAGLGSPKGASLVADLVASTLTTPLTTIPGSGQSGSGTAPTAPTQPTGGGKSHHHPTKHAKTIKHGASHPTVVSKHRVVAQGLARKRASEIEYWILTWVIGDGVEARPVSGPSPVRSRGNGV